MTDTESISPDPYWWHGHDWPASDDAMPAEADVVVVGGGLTGLSAARTLAREGRSVCVLDAEQIGYGCSSRNGGMAGGGHRLSWDLLRARHGEDVATRTVREAYVESLAFARALIDDEEIACDFRMTGRFTASWSSRDHEAECRRMETLQRAAQVPFEVIPKAKQEAQVATALYAGGILLPEHGALDPARYHAGLAAAARRAGAVLIGNTPVTAVTLAGKSLAGWMVDTPAGRVRAGDVLLATNGWTRAPFSAHARRIVPVPSFIIATEPLGRERCDALIPGRAMIVETRARHCYYRQSPDGTRLLFGTRVAICDIEGEKATEKARQIMLGVFPELKDARLTHSWRGYTGFTFATTPHVGQIDGLWHAMGYCGNGNTMAPYLGHKAAMAMLGRPEGETAFAQMHFPARWWRPGAATWFLPAANMLFGLKDLVDNIRKGRL